jgi:hypothetical protein
MNTTQTANTNTTTTAAPAKPTPLHPSLRSLWNIPHIIRIPDPMPPVPEVIDLITARAVQCRLERSLLDRDADDYPEEVTNLNHEIDILENKLDEIHRAFPDLVESLDQSTDDPPTNDFSALNDDENPEAPSEQHDPECTASAQECTTGVRGRTNGENVDAIGRQWETNGVQEGATTSPQPSANETTEPPEQTRANSAGTEPSSENEKTSANKPGPNNDANEFDRFYQRKAELQARYNGFESHAEQMADAAEDLKSQLTGRNRFDRLNSEQQAAIITLIKQGYSLDIVVKVLALPQPDGLDFKISKSGLAKFVKRYEALEESRRVTQNAKAAADLIDKSSDPDQAFPKAIERLLRMRLLTTASEPNAPLDAIDTLMNTLTKLRKQTLAERKQLHIEKQDAIKNNKRSREDNGPANVAYR